MNRYKRYYIDRNHANSKRPLTRNQAFKQHSLRPLVGKLGNLITNNLQRRIHGLSK